MQLARSNPHSVALLDVLTPNMKTFDGGGPDLNETPGDKGWGWQGTPGQSRFLPYRILRAVTGGVNYGEDLGTLGCPFDDASLIWQVTCVGATARQCEAIVDDTTALLVGQPLTVPDRFIMQVKLDMFGGVVEDPEVQPQVFMGVPRYRVETTPLAPGGS